MKLRSLLKNGSDHIEMPIPPALEVRAEVIDDVELDRKRRVALMMQDITYEVLGEIEANIAPLPDGEGRDDFYVLAMRLGEYAADLKQMRQDREAVQTTTELTK